MNTGFTLVLEHASQLKFGELNPSTHDEYLKIYDIYFENEYINVFGSENLELLKKLILNSYWKYKVLDAFVNYKRTGNCCSPVEKGDLEYVLGILQDTKQFVLAGADISTLWGNEFTELTPFQMSLLTINGVILVSNENMLWNPIFDPKYKLPV